MSIDELLEAARTDLRRLDSAATADAVERGALLVDIRPVAQRAAEGHIPGALIIERNVLEWRLDPQSDARLPEASYERPVIVFCSGGYASSLAAASLRALGLDATDLIGGFQDWAALGYPTRGGRRASLVGCVDLS
ncbi:rhodanese-like domain-containing protein [Longispora urticae]